MLKPNVPAWFEIPAANLDRAQKFYETILGVDLKRENMGMPMAVFPRGDRPNATGALISGEHATPSVHGSIIYLHVDDVKPVLARVKTQGGDTVVPRTQLPDNIGFFAQIIDSEGNRVGLFSQV